NLAVSMTSPSCRIESIHRGLRALALAETLAEGVQALPGRDVEDLAEGKVLENAEEGDLEEAEHAVFGKGGERGVDVLFEVVEASLDAGHELGERRLLVHSQGDERDLGG